MGWLDNIKGAVGGGVDYFTKEAAKYNDRGYRDSLVAICALIAAADGDVEKEERAKFGEIIRKNAVLRSYDSSALAVQFDKYCGLALDEITKGDVTAVVLKLASDKPKFISAIRMGLFVAKADGDFEPEEKAALVDLCKQADVPPGDISADLAA